MRAKPPRYGRHMDDLVGTAPIAVEDAEGEAAFPSWWHSATALALTALPLALLTLWGPALFKGLNYTAQFAPANSVIRGNGGNTATGYLIAGAFLSVAFSLLPMLSALQGLRRLASVDARWVPAALRAAIALSSLSLVLRTVLAIIVVTSQDGSAGSIINFLGSA